MDMANHYGAFPGATNRLEQYKLQKLAKDIMGNGIVTDVHYHTFGTNMYKDDYSFETFRDGSRCVVVEGFGMKYYIHFNGLRVTEIIEQDDALLPR
jgi:hypothetical protein